MAVFLCLARRRAEGTEAAGMAARMRMLAIPNPHFPQARTPSPRPTSCSTRWRNPIYLRGLGPFLTTRLTLEPAGSRLPALGRWPRTLPFLRRLEKRLVIFPTLQWALAILVRAFFSFSPITLGTTQGMIFWNVAVTA
jgi:hypothetical protein